jgi:hypothetical protein
MPPVTRRSTGAVAKVRYHDFTSDSADSATDSRSAKRPEKGKRGRKTNEESDFELSAANESSSESAESSHSVSAAEVDMKDEEEPIFEGRPSRPNVSWAPVTKLPLFHATLLSTEECDIIEDSLRYLDRSESWLSDLRSFLHDSFQSSNDRGSLNDDPLIINMILEFLNKREVPAVYLFVNSSFRGIQADKIKTYFSHLQGLARHILYML